MQELLWIGDHLVDPSVPVGYLTKRDGSIKAIFRIAGGAVYQPTGTGSVHFDMALTQVSLGWPNNGLVGENLFPSVTVRKQSDKYYQFGREAWLPEVGDYRAPGTEANEIPGFHVSIDTYYAQEHALQIAVTDEERENVDSEFAPDQDGTNLVTSKIMLAREVSMQTLVTTVANFASGLSVTLSGTTQWSDYVNSNPISDMKTGIRAVNAKVFMDPNLAVIPYQVMSILEDHPDIIERIKYSERAVLTPEIIGAVFGIPKIIVPGVALGTGTPGTLGNAITGSYLWGKDVLLAWVPDSPGLKVPAFGYEFVWGYPGAGAMMVDRWREDKRASDLIRARRRYDLKLVGVEINPGSGDFGKSVTGYIIKAAVL